jgi:hypothetical protein
VPDQFLPGPGEQPAPGLIDVDKAEVHDRATGANRLGEHATLRIGVQHRQQFRIGQSTDPLNHPVPFQRNTVERSTSHAAVIGHLPRTPAVCLCNVRGIASMRSQPAVKAHHGATFEMEEATGPWVSVGGQRVRIPLGPSNRSAERRGRCGEDLFLADGE